MSEPLHISTTMGRELTLMAAQPIPSTTMTAYRTGEKPPPAKVHTAQNAKPPPSMQMPTRMVRLRPTLPAMCPTGM